jgi:creatinine amidohydrolase
MTSVKWGELTAEELAAAVERNPLVILPLGCTEQHAGHLPVDTDTYQVERLTIEGAEKAAQRHETRVLVLPPCPTDRLPSTTGSPVRSACRTRSICRW